MSRLRMVFVVLLVLLNACGSPATRRVQLTEQDAGRTVELRRGTQVEVILDGNPTTGYQWKVADGDPAIIKQVGEPTFKPDSAALGSGGKVSLVFDTLAAGQTNLRLIYHRSFEPNVPPLHTFEVTVVVT